MCALGRNRQVETSRPGGKKTLLKDQIVSAAFHPHMGHVALQHKASARMAAMRLTHVMINDPKVALFLRLPLDPLQIGEGDIVERVVTKIDITRCVRGELQEVGARADQ